MSLLEGYRLFTGYYIYESEELPSEGKLEYIRFLKEASGDDIIDILSGQYEGIEGLTEEEMEAVNDFIEERYGKETAKKVGRGVATQVQKTIHAMKPETIKRKAGVMKRGLEKGMKKGKEFKKLQPGQRSMAKGRRIKRSAERAMGRAKRGAASLARAGAGYGAAAGAAGGAGYVAKKKMEK